MLIEMKTIIFWNRIYPHNDNKYELNFKSISRVG